MVLAGGVRLIKFGYLTLLVATIYKILLQGQSYKQPLCSLSQAAINSPCHAHLLSLSKGLFLADNTFINFK
jgi:hypothetical protein